MKKKVYAIKEGYDFNKNKKIENVIVDTWGECLKYVKGVKGAKYKSFEDIDSAKEYLNNKNKLLKKEIDEYPMECLHLYVDGSYNISTEKYSYGIVAVQNNVVKYIESGASNDISKKNIRQIAGELEGTIKAIEYALKEGEKKVVLFHDYVGIFYHATGEWERKDKSSQEYYDKIKKLFSEGIDVTFVKVNSHTGDLYNELVDEFCKKELSICSDNIVEKYLLENKIYVLNENLKSKIISLTNSNKDNIIIKER